MGHPGVLVTGSHRSGSTWVGRLLASSDQLHYVHEPFNIVARVRWTSRRPPYQFAYLRPGIPPTGWATDLDRVMALRLPIRAQLLDAARHRRLRRLASTGRQARHARGQGRSILLKDPIALFSTSWLVERYGLRPVILVRNPRAFVGSLKERNWAFDFHHWLDQPELMEDLLGGHAAAIHRQVTRPQPIVDQAIVQWNAMYSVVGRFADEHPDWVVIRYEDLAQQPATEIPRLFDRLGLRFGSRQAEILSELTSGGGGDSAMDLRRDPTAATTTWKDRLSDDEIALVDHGTREIASRWYP